MAWAFAGRTYHIVGSHVTAQLIYKRSYWNFPESRKKYNLVSNIIFFILTADSKYCLFRWKKNESDTVKSECPVQVFRKIVNYLKI